MTSVAKRRPQLMDPKIKVIFIIIYLASVIKTFNQNWTDEKKFYTFLNLKKFYFIVYIP